MADGWELAAKTRTDFADLIEGLTDEHWDSPSLCEGWAVRDVAGHIVSFIELSLPALMFRPKAALTPIRRSTPRPRSSALVRPRKSRRSFAPTQQSLRR